MRSKKRLTNLTSTFRLA